MMRSKQLLSLLMGLALLLITNNVFAVKTPIVFPDENALFYSSETSEEVLTAQGWASIMKGAEERLEVAITASGLVKDCRYGVRFIDPSKGKKEDLGILVTDEEGKGVFSTGVFPDHLRDWKLVEVYAGASCAGGGSGERILSFNLEETGKRG